MGDRNGYFRLICNPQGTMLRLFAPQGNGCRVETKEVMDYLAMNRVPYDLQLLGKGMQEFSASEKSEHTIVLNRDALMEVRGSYQLTVSEDRMRAVMRAYPPSANGEAITADEILRDLSIRKITFGLQEKALRGFMENPAYCTDFIVAIGVEPRQGTDAQIEYFFETDRKAKPALLEDGSVDFFHLNTISHCKKGDLLARLIPEDKGNAGMSVYGERIMPHEVKKKVLSFGRNIVLSEDRTTLTADTDGHAMLIDGKVFVSNVLELENVDISTGNIDYEGSVKVNGNVCANFEVHAHGNIEVAGIVEGARLVAGGNIIIARGMNGMARGELVAGGNIVAKFIENAKVSAEGSVSTESILHSNVASGTQITVTGKKGFITGGRVCATSLIRVKTLGSPMGADTIVEVGMDPTKKARMQELQKEMGEITRLLTQITPVISAISQKLAQGAKLKPEQVASLQEMLRKEKQLREHRNNNAGELDALQQLLSESTRASIEVTGEVYSGTKISISDVSLVVKDGFAHCRFIRERGDVKMTAL